MNKFYRTPVVTSIVMLILALLNMPEGYITLLRIIVSGTAIYLLLTAKGIGKLSWVWIMGFIAILFNPFIPIYFIKKVWSFIDVVVAITFVTAIFAITQKSFETFKKWAVIIIGLLFISALFWFASLKCINIGTNNKIKSLEPLTELEILKKNWSDTYSSHLLSKEDNKSYIIDEIKCVMVVATGDKLGFPLNTPDDQISPIIEKYLNEKKIKYDKEHIYDEIMSMTKFMGKK